MQNIQDEAYVSMVLENCETQAITLQEIEEATAKDEELKQLKEAIRCNKLKETGSMKDYKHIFDELSMNTDQTIIIRGKQILIPSSNAACMKEKFSSLWFPNIDKQIEKL